MSSCYLFENGTIIDGTGAAARPGAVLVENDKIAAIGEDAARRATGEATRIDARGMTVMPGLIDAHVHLSFDDAQSNAEIFYHRRNRAVRARRRVQRAQGPARGRDQHPRPRLGLRVHDRRARCDRVRSRGGPAHRVRRLRADDVGRRHRRPPHSRSRCDRLGQGAEGQGRDRRGGAPPDQDRRRLDQGPRHRPHSAPEAQGRAVGLDAGRAASCCATSRTTSARPSSAIVAAPSRCAMPPTPASTSSITRRAWTTRRWKPSSTSACPSRPR